MKKGRKYVIIFAIRLLFLHIFLIFSIWIFAPLSKLGASGPGFIRMTAPGFMENRGQFVDETGEPLSGILFGMIGNSIRVYISRSGLHYFFTRFDSAGQKGDDFSGLFGQQVHSGSKQEPRQVSTHPLSMELVGSNPDPEIKREKMGFYYENFYLPHCPSGITNVPSFDQITMINVYPDIDWVIYRDGDFMKYDFVCHPGSDPSTIRMKWKGQSTLKTDENGNLVVTTVFGEIIEGAPISYLEGTGEKISSPFAISGNEVNFEIDYCGNHILRIDPQIVWATYYGGSDSDAAGEIDTDNFGNVYVAGGTYSTSGISFSGYQNAIAGNNDLFLVKFDTSGNRIWGTYFGGTGQELGGSCKCDNQFNIYLCSTTNSGSGIASGGHQNIYGGGTFDALLAKFDSSGFLKWSTYYGGNSEDIGTRCVTDDFENVYLCGSTQSFNAISYFGHQNSHGGGFNDGFLVKFDSSGLRKWATYYGGNKADFINSCDVDPVNHIYIFGNTSSTSGISYNGFQDTLGGNGLAFPPPDAFVAKFDPAGIRKWGTYKGGISSESCTNGVVSKDFGIYLLGYTPGTTGISFGGFQNSSGGGTFDAFVVKFDSSGNGLWGTYYGGPNGDLLRSATLDHIGNLIVCGWTGSLTSIASSGFQNNFGGSNSDCFLVKFGPAGNRIWGSYYGGNGSDYGGGCVADGQTGLYFSGNTDSQSGIAINGFQNTYGGGIADAFLARIQHCDHTADSISLNICDSLVSPSGKYIWKATGTWLDTIFNSSGCDSIMTFYVNVNQSSVAYDTVLACNSYTWPANGNTYLGSGNHSAILPNSAGCDSVINLSLNVIVVDTSIDDSANWIMANAAPAFYQWLDCGNSYLSIAGATNQSYFPSGSGSYAVQITQNGCVDTSACDSITILSTGQKLPSGNIKVFPNPNAGVFNLEISGLSGLAELIVWDSKGAQILLRNIAVPFREEVGMPGIAGIFTLGIRTRDGFLSRKFVVQ